MSKVSLQKQTKDLISAAEKISKKINDAQTRVKNQVVWLQDAEKNLKEKNRQKKLLLKQQEEQQKAQLEIKKAEEVAEKNEEKPEKKATEVKVADNKAEKVAPSEIKKEDKSSPSKPKEKTIKPAKKEGKEHVHKKSVVPKKKTAKLSEDKSDKKETIINLDDKPRRPIGIRVVKRAPTAEEIAAAKKESQLKRQQSIERRKAAQQERKDKQPNKQGGYQQRQGNRPNQQGGYQQRQGNRPNQQGGYQQRQGDRPNQKGGYQQRQGDNRQRTNNYQNRNGNNTFQNRPGQGDRSNNTYKPKAKVAPVETSFASRTNSRKRVKGNKTTYQQSQNNNQRQKPKKTLIREQNSKKFVFGDVYSPTGSRRKGPRKNNQRKAIERIVIEHAVISTKTVAIKELAEKIGKPGAEIIKQLFLLGIISNINQSIDFDTAALVASELGVTLEQKVEKTNEEKMVEAHDDSVDDTNLVKRAPIVTVMGHVDHGKTSLLDAIRKSNVIQGEAGGITQHIGAYTINHNDEDVTFIDTPGHEAFTAMRARGAQVTDIAVLVVAADDGVMPQTIEAINHAKAAEVPIIVAINKMDKAGANPERVKQELTEYELVTEEWGGDTIMVPVSAINNEGIDALLENILLIAEVQELKANPNTSAKGTIVEAQLDTGRGPVATVLIQNGTLKVGDSIVAGTITGRVRAMIDDKGNRVTEAGPSTPVEVLGFSSVPLASAVMYVADDRLSRKVAADRKSQIREDQIKSSQMVTLDDLFNKINEGKLQDLNIVLKADVQGSVEAMKQSLVKLSNEEVRVNIKHSGVGAVSESDVILASASNAIIIGFNVRPDAKGRAAAVKENVEIRTYRIIYNALEDIEKAIKGMLKPVFEEQVQGHAEVRNVIKIGGVGTIAGSYITDGFFTRNSSARVLRDSVIIYEGALASLRRFKDDVKEVKQGYECGIMVENFSDVKEGDIIEAFVMKEIKK